MPVAFEIRWQYVLLHLAVLITAVSGSVALLGDAGYLSGFLIYIACKRGAPAVLAKDHNAGMRHYQRRHWSEALTHFKRSQAFFERYPDSWLAEGILKTMDAGVAAFQSGTG
jgi:hypothetical protein